MTHGFRVRCEYYKTSGEWYASGSFSARLAEPYHNEAFDLVRRMARGQHVQPLPGLQSGTWDGPIRVTVVEDGEDGLPALILPEQEDDK